MLLIPRAATPIPAQAQGHFYEGTDTQVETNSRRQTDTDKYRRRHQETVKQARTHGGSHEEGQMERVKWTGSQTQ
eukprot:1749988-Pleurochrysis_carterae.AAC.2